MQKEGISLLEEGPAEPGVRVSGVICTDRVGGGEKTETDSDDCWTEKKLLESLLELSMECLLNMRINGPERINVKSKYYSRM